MKPEAQRIAIAEWMGWEWYRIPQSEKHGHGPLRCLFRPSWHEYDGQSSAWLIKADGTERICNLVYLWREGRVPDYLNDLNAIHDAEKMLQDKCKYWPDYIDELSKQFQFQIKLPDWRTVNWSQMCHASASQRAEALLRALNLWKNA